MEKYSQREDALEVNIARVVIIDDDLFVRSSLPPALKSFGIEVIGTMATYSEAVALIDKDAVDVVIVDLDLGPGPSGIDICYSLRSSYPRIGLVLLTSYTNPKIADPYSRPLPPGCRFVSKSSLSDFETLVNQILSARIKPLNPAKSHKSRALLTDTQIEVLKLLSSGLSNSEIAAQRNVSIKSIDGTISKIYKALALEKSKSMNQRVQLARAYFNLSGKKPPGD